MSADISLSVFNGDEVKYPTLVDLNDVKENSEQSRQEFKYLGKHSIGEHVSFALILLIIYCFD